jgi:hypothetical protein
MPTSTSNPLPFNKALDLLHRKDARLVKQHGRDGDEFFVLPGGQRVRPDDAHKILGRTDMVVGDRGLFANFAQSWMMSRSSL